MTFLLAEPKRIGFQSTWHPNPRDSVEKLFKAGSAARLLRSQGTLPG